ncbi:UNKNOWN [Stylonychia lemnae]|uniref:Uncharacterized protein n=1 Tax=Stylonychia lemnae TaxID=5949 RepID=A0A078AB27_STYLE|nr:UNKNOWN [Stylonychia lemnae]|eukprot:CDW78812.1 UNKNOWN [Stylonychia lemnae]
MQVTKDSFDWAVGLEPPISWNTQNATFNIYQYFSLYVIVNDPELGKQTYVQLAPCQDYRFFNDSQFKVHLEDAEDNNFQLLCTEDNQ